MELVGQMYKLSACFDTPSEYKGLPYDYFPEEAVTYGSTVCSFGLCYNDHNYGMPIGLTPPVMAPHLMDPVPNPKKTLNNLNPQWTKMEPRNDLSLEDVAMIKMESEVPINTGDSFSTSSNTCTPRKQYLDENDYPVYVEPEIKVVEVPSSLCVSASDYSGCTSESSDDDGQYNPDFIVYLKKLPKKHESVERYLNKAQQKLEVCPSSRKSSESERRECSGSDFVIDCICGYSYDDKRMVQCESCGVRQHIDCMYTNPRQVQNFLKHRCHKCSDIPIDVDRAKAIQQSRKNWHLTADRMANQKTKYFRSEEGKRTREFMVNFREIKTDRRHGDHYKSNKNLAAGTTRVNKRKQDLKACMTSEVTQTGPVRSTGGDGGGSSVSSGSSNDPDMEHGPSTNETGETIEAKLPSSTSEHNVATPTVIEDCATGKHHYFLNDINKDINKRVSSIISAGNVSSCIVVTSSNAPGLISSTTVNSTASASTGHGNRRHQHQQLMRKDYKDATKSLYSTKLLQKVSEITLASEQQEEQQNQQKKQQPQQTQITDVNTTGTSDHSLFSIDQGCEFLDRNPRCRIVIFDSATMGIEASVRLQTGSIVAALTGKMMLMDEYLQCTNPTTEYRPYVFLYHMFAENGLVIDCSNYGNITRYLRRSCDPNVKLEHMIIGGVLYVVIRTTAEVYQGQELTMPFDIPFELCQYAVPCACGKVRCPAVKHRRKHHRIRVTPGTAAAVAAAAAAGINCEQVIEDKLRELSQPIISAGSPGGGGGGPSCSDSPNSTPRSQRHFHHHHTTSHRTGSGGSSSCNTTPNPSRNAGTPRYGIVSRPSITACLDFARTKPPGLSANRPQLTAVRTAVSSPGKFISNELTATTSFESDCVPQVPQEQKEINKFESSADLVESNINIYRERCTPNKEEDPSPLSTEEIKTEEIEPIVINDDQAAQINGQNKLNIENEEEMSETDSVKTTPSKQVSNKSDKLTGEPIILTSKRQPKPVYRPDFEMNFDSHVLSRQRIPVKNSSNLKIAKKEEQQIITPSNSNKVTTSGSILIKTEDIEVDNEGEFKSIITTRRQKKSNQNVSSKELIQQSPRRTKIKPKK